MRDSDIRLALHDLLWTKHGSEPDTLIRHEVGLCAGKRRIDVALVNGELAGYEIKSDEDTLSRLAGQAEAYGRVLDRAILVTTKRHLGDALAELPNWWGVIVAHEEHGVILLESIRDPGLNDRHDMFSLAQLLWREEALEELRLRDKGHGLSKKARYYVWAALAAAVSPNDLRSIVRARLKARQEWPGGQLRLPNGVTPHTIAIE
ncbi:MAG: sce7726 family protein [Chloroflexi bacterium]|nr:sce7726 family protein [Chloroflexota bacterium]